MERTTRIGLLSTLLLVIVTGAGRADSRATPKPQAFLQNELPLGLVLTTPVEIATSSANAVTLLGRQAVTAVFTRPVIAIGSDFGAPAAQQKLPFRLSCSVPGKTRWVTTTIARFDPDVDWPTDLDCSLSWAQDLTTYDGAPLQLGDVPATRSLTSNPLDMSITDVLSEQALALTDNLWSAAPEGGAPEVPPDGRILVSFTYPVNLELLKSALKVLEEGNNNGPTINFDVRPCQSPAPWFYYPMVKAAAEAVGLSTDVNSTCAEVVPTSQLKPATRYQLVMRAGARYHALAGSLRKALTAAFTGLRPFQIPFNTALQTQYQYNGVSYRRLDLWLPHGLSSGTSPQALARQISLCEQQEQSSACTAVAFDLSLVSKGKARLSVPALRPDTMYRITVAAGNSVQDGFGQGLQASTLTFLAAPVTYAFAAPTTRTSVAVLDATSETLQSWPVVTRSPVRAVHAHYYADNTARSVLQAWEVDLTRKEVRDKVAKVLTKAYYFDFDLASLLGTPTVVVRVPQPLRTATASRDAQWTQLDLPLKGVTGAPARATIVSHCCNQQGHSSYGKLLLNTTLSLSVIRSGSTFTAWLLDSAPGGGPVAGAAVSVYYVPRPSGFTSWMEPDPEQLAQCTTDAEGTCTFTTAEQASWRSLMAFAVSGGQAAVLENAGFLYDDTPPPAFVASLVADRRLIVPGDKLKVTGFLQQVTPAGLQLPPATYASLAVSPAWDTAPSSGLPGSSVSIGRGLLADGGAASVASEDSVVPFAGMDAARGMHVEEAPRREAQQVVAAADLMVGKPLIVVTPSASNGQESTQVIVKVDGTTGTLHGEIAVPENARMQTYTVRISLPDSSDPAANPGGPQPAAATAGSWNPLPAAAFTFTVADPRPPTAELKLETTPWVPPTGVIVVNITAVSYIGASVDNSAMTVTWRHAKAAGVLSLLTDRAGFATASVDLGALPEANRTDLYDNVVINVEWMGPTRERITKDAHVTLADGPARLELQPSLDTAVPGTAFSVAATLTSNIDGTPLPGLPVTATLKPLPSDTTAVACAAGSTAPSCSVSSGAAPAPACQLALPCVGHFELEACAEVPLPSGGSATSRVCSRLTLGRNTTEWAAEPLSRHAQPQLFTDRSSYSIGDLVQLSFQSPWPGARLLVQWGNTRARRSKIVASLPTAGLAQVTIGPLGNECLGGCSVIAVLDVPRLAVAQLPALPPADQLVVSRLFDPLAPHVHSMFASLTVQPDNKLAVSVEVTAAVPAASTSIKDSDGEAVLAIEPGAEAEITVSVKSGSEANDPPPKEGSVEVTVYAVDKAFLDLLPYDLPKPEEEVLLRWAADLSSCNMDSNRLAPGAVQAVYQKLIARLTGQDPWLPVDTRTFPGNAAVDTPDGEYLARYFSALTQMPSWRGMPTEGGPVLGGGMYEAESMLAMPRPGALPNQAAAAVTPDSTAQKNNGDNSRDRNSASRDKVPSSPTSATAAGTDGSPAVRQESDFVVTPLFATAKTGVDGRAKVTFTAPVNLGTFVIRAFAAQGSAAKYGSAESKVAVQRAISLTPSAPRFVRVGDVFEAGVVVTVGSSPASITVALALKAPADSPLTLEGAASKVVIFTVEGGLQQEVRFSFSAAAVGTARLVLTASEGAQPGAGQDSLEIEVPVMGQQGDVWVATSFALTATAAGDASAWQEGMELPAAVPGSGGLSLTAGVGYFPSIAAVYDNLELQEKDRSFPTSQPALLWATLPAVLSYYGQPVSPDQSSLVSTGLSDLVRLTHGSLGLLWSDPSRWSGWQPQRVDLYLNTWALFVAAQHRNPAPGAPGALVAGWNSLQADQVPIWRQAVQTQLVADAQESRNRDSVPYSDWYTLAWARLVLGADWVPPGAPDQIVQDLSLDALLAAAGKVAGRETRVTTALLLHAMGPRNPRPEVVKAVVGEVTSALRVQGRTAYVAVGQGSAAAASVSEQALSLLLLVRSGATHQLLPKLAAYVANPAPRTGLLPFCVAPSWAEQGLALAALAEYDQARGSSKPSVELLAQANGLTVLEAAFKAATGSLKPVSNTTAWEDLPGAPTGSKSKLSFEAIGSGEVSVAASLHFVPAALLPFPTYRGLFVEAALQLADPLTGGPSGQRLAAVPLGAVVVYTVQVTTPDDLGPVTVEVMMPGGLEPLDPNVAAGVALRCDASWVDPGAWGFFYRWWWWPVCPAQETRPSLVTFSYLSLRAGTSSVSVRAVAATAGTFVLPPVRASADSQPELMGMTAAANITVCASCIGPTYGTPPPPSYACPRDCSGNGICNLRTGRCTCDPGFSRSDCSRAVA